MKRMLRNNFKLAIFLVVLLNYGCKTFRPIQDKYCMVGGRGPDNTLLIFYKNKTFKGISYSDVMGEFLIKGIWKDSSRILITEPIKLSVIDSISLKYDPNIKRGIKIKVINQEYFKPIPDVQLTINQNESYISDSLGFITTNNKPIQISLSYHNINDSLKISSGDNNVISLFLNFKNIMSFNIPREWKIRGQRIVPLNKKFESFRKCK